MGNDRQIGQDAGRCMTDRSFWRCLNCGASFPDDVVECRGCGYVRPELVADKAVT